MNTQNLNYTEIAKENEIVASAFSARDDIQLEMDGIDEEIAELIRAKVEVGVRLIHADDKLALVATMAQEGKEREERIRAHYLHNTHVIITGLQDAHRDGELSDDSMISAASRVNDLFGVDAPEELDEDGKPF